MECLSFTLAIVILYIMGVLVAKDQIMFWLYHEENPKPYSLTTLFYYSLLSWLVYPIYYIVKIVYKLKNRQL